MIEDIYACRDLRRAWTGLVVLKLNEREPADETL